MSEPKSYPMTQSKLDALKAELEHKIEVERPALAKRLKAAIELGDLSENAEYISSKEAQGFLEGRIQELETMIRWATIIDENQGPSETVRLGSRVTVKEKSDDDPETFMIVGPVEASPRDGRISDESPIGQALIGRRAGDKVKVETPGGSLEFKIIKIE
jgi:transcription elongation factor GreA